MRLLRRSLPLAVVIIPFQIIGLGPVLPGLVVQPAAAGGFALAATRCPAPGGRSVPAAAVTGAGVVFQGHGWGHGLGMSQYGAQGAARLGCHHAQILAAYYARTHLVRSSMTAPVELTLLGAAKRSTVTTEAMAVSWVGGGHRLTQPPRTTWTVTTAAGVTTVSSSPRSRLLQVRGGSVVVAHAGRVVRLRSFTSASAAASATVAVRLRQGTLAFAGSSSSAMVSETITGNAAATSVDRYLWGLGEVPVSWPQEALRAQADAARTYLTHSYDARRRRYRIGVTTAAQVYRGADQEDTDARYRNPWHASVVATRGEIVVDSRGAPIWAMYSSSDGGRAESRAYVYGSQSGYGYLVGLDDSRWDLASDNPRRSWARTFAASDLARRLGFASVSAVTIAAPGSSARGNGLVVTGVRSGRTVTARFTGDQARGKLGLPSPVITVSWTSGTPAARTSGAAGASGSPVPGGASATPVTGTYTSSGCTGAVCGSVSARFSGTTVLVAVQETVQDRVCNRRRAYVRLLVRYTDGSSELTRVRYADNRCRPPANVYGGLGWHASKPIAGFAVVVGEAYGGWLTGRYQDSPIT